MREGVSRQRYQPTRSSSAGSTTARSRLALDRGCLAGVKQTELGSASGHHLWPSFIRHRQQRWPM